MQTASNEPQATKKFFGAAVFQKCCRGVGEQPTFAKQIRFCSLFFLLQLHFWKLTNSQFDCFYETSCKFGQGNGAIAARWQAKAGVEPPFAGCFRPFSLGEIALRKTTRIWFGRIASLSACVLFAGGCVVRIAYECFLDCSLPEISWFSRWRTEVYFVSLRSLLLLIIHSLLGAACPLHPSPS